MVEVQGAEADEKNEVDPPRNGKNSYFGRLGTKSRKIKAKEGKTYLWSSGPLVGSKSKWFDFTGSPIPAKDLQFGIGRDRIASIDDPFFVEATDPRLRTLPRSHYRPDERPDTIDDIVVIGVVINGDARAYPISLLDGHELVNDRVGGKPITVGW